MAATIDPIPADVETTTTQTIQADSLSIDRLSIDGSGRDKAPWTAEIVIVPYKAAAGDQPNIYAATREAFATKDLLATATAIPEVGAAIAAVFAATTAWHNFRLPRLATLATAQAASDAANATLAQKQAAFDASVIARNQAFTARTGVDDPAWVAATDAWTQAGIDRDQAQQAADVAAGRLAIAQAAVDDPANPALEAQA